MDCTGDLEDSMLLIGTVMKEQKGEMSITSNPI